MSRLFEKSSEKLQAYASPTLAPCEFSAGQRRQLLRIAHDSILSIFDGRPYPEANPDEKWLLEPRGAFTTLYLHGELRGCVGYAMPVAPLVRAVAETARAAAFNDSRFMPVATTEEALALEVSLSILSPLFTINPDDVVAGKHGLLISRGARRGLLLPQVPIENEWDRETFLEQTCRKAGLPLDAWRHGTTIQAFTAEVFADQP
jgi:AmmeMemoRadiSam system protein A